MRLLLLSCALAFTASAAETKRLAVLELNALRLPDGDRASFQATSSGRRRCNSCPSWG